MREMVSHRVYVNTAPQSISWTTVAYANVCNSDIDLPVKLENLAHAYNNMVEARDRYIANFGDYSNVNPEHIYPFNTTRDVIEGELRMLTVDHKIEYVVDEYYITRFYHTS